MDIESTLRIYTLCVCYMYDLISSLQTHGELGTVVPIVQMDKGMGEANITHSKSGS